MKERTSMTHDTPLIYNFSPSSSQWENKRRTRNEGDANQLQTNRGETDSFICSLLHVKSSSMKLSEQLRDHFDEEEGRAKI